MNSTVPQTVPPCVSRLLAALHERADRAGVFGPIEHSASILSCAARASAEPAFFRIFFDSGKVWVGLVTADRWLSQSIEADLVHTGDKLEDLIEEELVDQGYDRGAPRCEHFRSEDKLFTFRTALPFEAALADSPESLRIAEQFLLAYEAAFRNLGDMTASEDDE